MALLNCNVINATLKRRLALHVKVDFVLLVERFIQIIGLIIC